MSTHVLRLKTAESS